MKVQQVARWLGGIPRQKEVHTAGYWLGWLLRARMVGGDQNPPGWAGSGIKLQEGMRKRTTENARIGEKTRTGVSRRY